MAGNANTKIAVGEIERQLEAAAAFGSYFEALPTAPDETGWISAASLAAPGSPALAALLARIEHETGSSNGRVLSAFLVHRHAWRIAAPAAAVYLAADLLPDLAPDAVWLKPADEPPGVAYSGVWGIGNGSVARREAMETWFRNGLIAHLAPLIAELRAALPLGRRAMWLIAADACASAFLAAGEQLGRERQAVARIRSALLDPPGTPFRGRTAFFTLTVDGRRRTVVRRGSCCQSFRIDDVLCSTCPRVPEREQRKRVREELLAG
jgi:hypothetical protein